MNKYEKMERDQAKTVIGTLSMYGHKTQDFSYGKSPFDVLLDGKIKIEIKTGHYSEKYKQWTFNIHRHNILDESGVDFYVLRFNSIPGTNRAIHALYKAPLKKRTMTFSIRQLLEGKIHQSVKDFRKLNIRNKKA